MAEIRIDRRHHFFAPIQVYSVAIASSLAFARWKKLAQLLRDNPPGLDLHRGMLDLASSVPGRIELEGAVVNCQIENLAHLVGAVINGSPITELGYREIGGLGELHGEIAVNTGEEHQFSMCQVVLGTSYEQVEERLKSQYGKNPTQWPRLLDYFRHVRNACFHRNQFHFIVPRGKSTAINPASPPQWRASVMPSDHAMRGQTLFDKTLKVGDVVPFLNDVHLRLVSDGILP